MSTAVKGGVFLGLLTVAWTFVMGSTGWYKDPVLLFLFWIVVLFELAVLVWALRKTAAEGATYGKQIVNGLVLSVVAAKIIFVGSLLFTTVAFPSYFEDLRVLHAESLRSSGMAEEEIARAVEMSASMQTPFIQAMSGFLGTLVTGLVLSLILGVFFRKKGA